MMGAMTEVELPFAGDNARREAGLVIQEERFQRGFTAEQAAKRARVAYKTWLRIESGKKVRALSWNGVDRLFGLTPGTARNLTSIDELRSQLKDSYNSQVRDMGGPPIAVESGKFTLSELDADEQPRLADRIVGLNLIELRRLRDMVDAAIAVHERSLRTSGVVLNYALLIEKLERMESVVAKMREDASADPADIAHWIETIRMTRDQLRHVDEHHPQVQAAVAELMKEMSGSGVSIEDLQNFFKKTIEAGKDHGQH